MSIKKKTKKKVFEFTKEVETFFLKRLEFCFEQSVILARRTKNPVCSFSYSNFSYIGKNQLLLCSLVLLTTTSEELFSTCVDDLLARLSTELDNDLTKFDFYILLIRLLNERRESVLAGNGLSGMKPYRWERLLSVVKPRRLLGLLGDKNVRRRVRRRFKTTFEFTDGPKRSNRIRGYRDQGTAASLKVLNGRQILEDEMDSLYCGKLSYREFISLSDLLHDKIVQDILSDPWGRSFGSKSIYGQYFR